MSKLKEDYNLFQFILDDLSELCIKILIKAIQHHI